MLLQTPTAPPVPVESLPMSGDEVMLTIVSFVTMLVAWGSWQYRTTTVGVRGMPSEGRPLVRVLPVVCIVLLWLVLRTLASYDVREDARYLLMYTLFGLAWVGVAIRFTALAGVSMRDDVLERYNGAAAIVLSGAMLGLTLAFAGGNIGDGPGWWVVLYSAGLSTAALFGAWLALDALAHVSDGVTVERDHATALRLAGFLVAEGLFLGRAVAGDWVSPEATLRDFALFACPAVLLVLIATPIERGLRPTPGRPAPSVSSHGLAPALVYVAVALGWIMQVGFGN